MARKFLLWSKFVSPVTMSLKICLSCYSRTGQKSCGNKRQAKRVAQSISGRTEIKLSVGYTLCFGVHHAPKEAIWYENLILVWKIWSLGGKRWGSLCTWSCRCLIFHEILDFTVGLASIRESASDVGMTFVIWTRAPPHEDVFWTKADLTGCNKLGKPSRRLRNDFLNLLNQLVHPRKGLEDLLGYPVPTKIGAGDAVPVGERRLLFHTSFEAATNCGTVWQVACSHVDVERQI